MSIRAQGIFPIVALTILFPVGIAVASPPSAEVFAQQPIMTGAGLSPDGTRVAFLSSLKGRFHLVIERFKPDFQRTIVAPIDEFEFEWVHWVSEDRLVVAMRYSSSRRLLETTETRLLSIDAEGRELTPIIKPGTRKETGSRIAKDLPTPQLQDHVVAWLPQDPEHILVAIDADLDGLDEVRRVDVRNGDYENVVNDFAGDFTWLSDPFGEVRLGWGYDGENLSVSIRNNEGRWSTTDDADWLRKQYVPLALTADPNVILVRGPDEAGRFVVRKLRLDTGEFLETVFEDDRIDADDIVIDDATGAPIGISFTRDLPAVDYFDAGFRKLQATIDHALPDRINRIVSASRKHRQVLILSYTDTNPGVYRLWDRDAKSLAQYGERMQGFGDYALAPVKPVSFDARDGLTIPAYLTVPRDRAAKKLPTVVLPHGGPHARDDESYWFITQFLASRGYVVFQPNFRGSSGYGMPFAEAGNKEWGGKMQDDVTDGTKWLIDQGIADPGRICIVGGSYGGYVAAIGAAKMPHLYHCAASINGVLNLPLQIEEDNRYFRGSEWTKYFGLEGESTKAVSPFHQAESITAPMLIIQSVDDTRVHKEQGRGMAKRLRDLGKPVEYVEIEFGGHGMGNVAARRQILESLETFLAENLGKAAPPAD
jgi:dipeptidyl aminopeptidase/acylaminoacyl peptidase